VARPAGITGPMTDMPPTRFRVVERGRRLEVIDTQAGKVPAPRVGKRAPPNLPSARTDPGRAWWPEKIRFDGGSVWTTRRFYDAKGPRTLTLDAGTVEQLRMAGGIAGAALIAWLVPASFVPALFGLPFLLASGKTRTALRNAATDWIDRVQAGQ